MATDHPIRVAFAAQSTNQSPLLAPESSEAAVASAGDPLWAITGAVVEAAEQHYAMQADEHDPEGHEAFLDYLDRLSGLVERWREVTLLCLTARKRERVISAVPPVEPVAGRSCR